MDFSIPEGLSFFGVTSEDFEEKKRDLSKSAKREVSEDEVFWELYKDLAKKAISFEILQMIYWNMAVFRDKLGQDSFEYQQKSHQSRLLNLKNQGKIKVKINANGCSSSCRKLQNLVIPISKAIKNLPIPNPECQATLNSKNIWCSSIYIVAKDSEVESKKLPPPVMNIPDVPKIGVNLKEIQNDPSLINENRIIHGDWSGRISLVFSAIIFFLSLSLYFYYPISSLILFFCSLIFSPPIMLFLRNFSPILNNKFKPFGTIGVVSLIVFLSFFLSLFSEININTFKEKKVITSYQVLSFEDRSILKRSRLYVSIIAPDARNAKERAQVVMRAARQIHDTQVYDDLKNIKYDYVFVTLEANKKNAGQGYVLAEAEYAPDSRGIGELQNNIKKKWKKWNVRSSNQNLNLNNMNSLKKVKESLETFLMK